MDERIYLDTFLLQQDMRVRLPKSVISNLGVEKGKTKFDIYLDSKEHCLIFKIHDEEKSEISKKLIAVSLFTRAGGMDVGFERPGIKVVFANEVMKEAAQTYITKRKL